MAGSNPKCETKFRERTCLNNRETWIFVKGMIAGLGLCLAGIVLGLVLIAIGVV